MPGQQRPEPPPKEPRGPFCAACDEAIDTEEEHYRSGLAWFHPKCYERFEKTPRKKPIA
jgi:hypothetical protein